MGVILRPSGAPVMAQSDASPVYPASSRPSPIESRVRELMRQMQDLNYTVRENAQRQLWELGEPAIPSLREALKSAAPEPNLRGTQVLEMLEVGLTPDAPPDVIAQFRAFAGATPDERIQMIEQISRDPRWVPALIQLCDRETDPRVREQLVALTRRHCLSLSRRWIADGSIDRAEQVLRSALLAGDDAAIECYLRILDDAGRTRESLQLASKLEPKLSATLRFSACRLLNDVSGAADAAKDLVTLRSMGPQKILWFESRDARSLADYFWTLARQEDANFNNCAEAAYFSYLAGDAPQTEQTLARLGEVARKSNDYGYMVAEVYFLTHHADRAIQILAEQSPRDALNLLWSRRQIAQAMALLDQPQPDVARRAQLQLGAAEQLLAAGCPDRAAALIDSAHRLLLPMEWDNSSWLWTQYARVMALSGRRDQVLAEAESRPAAQRLAWISALFAPSQQGPLATYWEFVNQTFGDVPLREKVKGLERLMAHDLPHDDAAAMAPKMIRWALALAPEKRRTAEDDVLNLLVGLSLRDEAREMMMQILQRDSGIDAYRRAMNHAISTENWRDAAWAAGMVCACYKDDPNNGLSGWGETLYIHGSMLKRTGEIDRGQTLMHRGRLMINGTNLRDAAAFMVRLERLGDFEEQARQRRWMELASDADDYDRANCMRQRAWQIMPQKHQEAADLLEWSLAIVCRTECSFMEQSAYLDIPFTIRDSRAWHFIEHKDFSAAAAQIRDAIEINPFDADWFATRYRILSDGGCKSDADAIFDMMWRRYEQSCNAVPDSPALANHIAWLGATCGRNLNECLRYSQQAVRQCPDQGNYLDTLALIQFQLGRVDEAVEIQTRAAKLLPDNAEVQKRLKEFRAAATQPSGSSDSR